MRPNEEGPAEKAGQQQVWDLAIIGAGAAGLTCAIYAGRGRQRTLLLEKMMPGGQVVLNDLIENYPGFAEGISGVELAQQMHRQAERFGAEIRTAEVTAIEIHKPFRITTTSKPVLAKSVLIATGCSPRRLGVPGEKEYYAKGVSYCATCDGPLFSGKPLLIVGGGNTAIDDALFLANIASEVIVVHRRNELRADLILQERAFENKKIRFLWSQVVTEIKGNSSVESVRTRHVETGEETDVSVAGVFIAVGETPQTSFLPEQIHRDTTGYVLTNEELATSVPGIFVAGDVRAGAYRQIAAAVGEGVIAYRSIRNYLETHERAATK
ncbi:MAG: thioredoxin-disulfide reductase [Armatimonadetes bacterium]|nr:thioredoxin-disulfide reductase [Armatimonadota bacterium]